MRTEVDLANAALAYLQRDVNMTSLDGTKPQAVQIRQHMPQAIEEVIEEYDWPQCRVISTLVVGEGIDLRGWTYAYIVPSDAVVIWRVADYKGTTLSEFEIGMSSDLASDTNYIFSDDADLVVRYGSSRVSVGRFSPQTFDLIARRLAIKCCMPLTKDKQLMQYLEKEYARLLSKVKTQMANLEPELVDVEFTPQTISVRSE